MFRLKFSLLVFLLMSCIRSEQTNTQANQSKSVVKITTATTTVVFEVEIADTNQKREMGLMYREHLPRDSGMLFIFDEDRVHSFWMKNTKLPLDLIFFDNKWRVVGVIENMQPYSRESRSIGKASRYVLEVNAGLVRQLGIVVGNSGHFQKLD